MNDKKKHEIAMKIAAQAISEIPPFTSEDEGETDETEGDVK